MSAGVMDVRTRNLPVPWVRPCEQGNRLAKEQVVPKPVGNLEAREDLGVGASIAQGLKKAEIPVLSSIPMQRALECGPTALR
jgi:hypothetical protein